MWEHHKLLKRYLLLDRLIGLIKAFSAWEVQLLYGILITVIYYVIHYDEPVSIYLKAIHNSDSQLDNIISHRCPWIPLTSLIEEQWRHSTY